jgi:phosphoserine phosphatase RsbU/P
VAARDGRFEDEGWRIRKDGTRLWANVIITALHGPDGAVIGFAKVTRDLTERREAEDNRRALAVERAAVAEKDRVQQFQERFLGILGHDLRNPLASIDMGTGIIRQRSTDPAVIRVADRMHASAVRMSRMIEQILDLTRSRLASGLEIKAEPMDLREVLTRMVDESKALHPSRVVELHCPALSGVWDRDRLEQVFSNLLGNALSYGAPDRPVTVRATADDQQVLVDVHNEGEPIPTALQPRLFDPFRRGERDSRTANTAGLGLGLYISSELVRAHGGTIVLWSSQAEGTTFRVALPREGARSKT